MRLNIQALAIAGAVVWGGGFFLVGLLNLFFGSYGTAFLELGASIYPGYHGPGGFGSVIVVTLYAALDGAVTAGIFGWLYNILLRSAAAPAA
jgi:hypothetical protein